VTGVCHGCGRVFEYDPASSPSVLVDVETGQPVPPDVELAACQQRPASWVRQPFCEPCADQAEAVARTLGLFPVWPAREAEKIRRPPE